MELNGGGWFLDRCKATGAPLCLAIAAGVAVVPQTVSAGTGGRVDDFQRLRSQRAGGVIENRLMPDTTDVVPQRTPAENVARIRDVLSPAVSDLARCFGVSRQAVYNWLNGEQPKPECAARLRDLALAADVIAESGAPVTGAVLKRRAIAGKTLFDVVREGGSARDAAHQLVRILRRERDERTRMATRLAGRKASSQPPEADFPAENDER